MTQAATAQDTQTATSYLALSDQAFDAIFPNTCPGGTAAAAGNPSILAWLTEFDSNLSEPSQIGSNFWLLGNTLHACVHYAVNRLTTKPDSCRAAMVHYLLDRCNTFFRAIVADPVNYDPTQAKAAGNNNPTFWWDDYGWWGNAFITAFEHADLFEGIPAKAYEDAGLEAPKTPSTRCDWLLNAHNVWAIMRSYSWQNGALHPPKPAPPVAGGCWQHEGVQVAVVNLLFFRLTCQLALAQKENATDFEACLPQTQGTAPFTGRLEFGVDDPGYAYWAQQSFNWFDAYIEKGLMTGGIIPRQPATPYHLLMGAIFPSNTSGAVWTGDQGLALAGFAAAGEMVNQGILDSGALSKAPNDLFDQLGNSIGILFSNDVLCETPFGGYITGDPEDMITGKGVFMRYLSNVLDQMPSTNGGYYQALITGTASAIQQATNSTTGLASPQWNTDWSTFAKNFYTQTWGYASRVFRDMPANRPAPWPSEVPYQNGFNSNQAYQITQQIIALDGLTAAIRYDS